MEQPLKKAATELSKQRAAKLDRIAAKPARLSPSRRLVIQPINTAEELMESGLVDYYLDEAFTGLSFPEQELYLQLCEPALG
jgi:hypothetical protein